MDKPDLDICGPMNECKGALAINLRGLPDGFTFVLFARGIHLATSKSPRALSNWAFRNGAQSVSHNYDLRLSPDK